MDAIEALDAKLRRVRIRGHSPTDEAATKLIWPVLHDARAEWKMPPREWVEAEIPVQELDPTRTAYGSRPAGGDANQVAELQRPAFCAQSCGCVDGADVNRR